MHIEPEARQIIMTVLEDRDVDSIVLEIINEDGNSTISLGVGKSAEADYVTQIDGINVIATPETLEVLQNAVFIVDEEGKLAVVQMGCCGGHEGGECGCGGHEGGECCGGGHEGGECCGGHEHGHSHEHHGGCGCDHNH